MCDESFNVTAVMEEGFCMPARLPSFETCPKGDSCPRDVTRRGDDSPEIAKQRMKVGGLWPNVNKTILKYCDLYIVLYFSFLLALNLSFLLRGGSLDLSKYATAPTGSLFAQTFNLSC